MTTKNTELMAIAAVFAFLLIAPFVIYPVFVMKVLCFALFACAFNLLIGYVGLLWACWPAPAPQRC
jgi:branched-chain amino acid transport system permease protein